ncbi:hypothetical protein Tco_1376061 [Tanacetum coccineum]
MPLIKLIFQTLKMSFKTFAFPQAIVPIDRFTFHEHVMDPLDISRNPSKEKGKKIASSSVISSTKLSPRSYHRAFKDDPNMSKEQRETKGMFKNLDDNDACMIFCFVFGVKIDVLVVFAEVCDPRIHHMVDL